jgi:hypothetical protein
MLLGGNGLHDSLTSTWQLLAGNQKQVLVLSPPYSAIAKLYVQHSRIAATYFEEIGLTVAVIEGAELDSAGTLDRIRSTSLVYLPGMDLRFLCNLPEQEQLPAAWAYLFGSGYIPSPCLALSAANVVALGEAVFVPVKPFAQRPEDQQYERLTGLGWIKGAVIFPGWELVSPPLARFFIEAMFKDMICIGIDTYGALGLTDVGWQACGAGSVHIVQQGVEQIFEADQIIPTSLITPDFLRGSNV